MNLIQEGVLICNINDKTLPITIDEVLLPSGHGDSFKKTD
jgi:hypothetical protein